MLDKQRGGSVADKFKSRDRQRKLDGLEKWHFRLVTESLPVMLQLALLLLGGRSQVDAGHGNPLVVTVSLQARDDRCGYQAS